MPSFDAIEPLVTAGKKIQAIKEFRALTGAGLKDSKDAVEYFEAHRQWPAQYLREPAPRSVPPPVASGPSPLRAELERLMASNQKIMAIKRLRELTRWGLKEAKEAVDHYQDGGVWSPAVLAVLDGSPSPAPALTPTPASTPTPAPTPSGPAAAVITTAPTEVAMLEALARLIGYAPEVLLSVPARRVAADGKLVVLRDRTCFMGEDEGQWTIDPVLSHDAVVSVEVHRGMQATLYVSLGYLHERFEMDPKDADAALALLRVYAR
ncbi:ribosomal protein L7/L12 [Paraliomyxa miuraensis]|uniref:ribosomal protein L7/L12 n=1 Tax=Paraliomyxa miuraensis TaxID=376150 RepID=UPI00224F1B00|nr:ribosomal protein L7/L12 [Paraliomyxa miuraensis]MCX4247321.1 hypothetical protein [Paraliomyxa miuraensis]